MNVELLVIVGVVLVALIWFFWFLCRPPNGGIVLAQPRRSWHGYYYVDDNTGRVIGEVRGYGSAWQAVGDLTVVYIDEASARRAVENGAVAKDALR